jgi:vitamin B12 transporter
MNLTALRPFRPALLLFCSLASAQTPPPDSTSKTYAADEVVVTGTRFARSAFRLSGLVSGVSRAELSTLPGSLVADALGSLPGVSFRTYGSGASVQILSLRGMPPEHTLVLVDGQRISSYQNGLVDFGTLSSASVERVEVAQGGYSALYGGDAVGGVVNIILTPSPREFSASAATTLGSDGFSAQELHIGFPIGQSGVRASVRHERGTGDYRYVFSDGRSATELRRSGEDFQTLNAEARADWLPSENVAAYVSGSWSDADRGSPGPVTDPTSAGGSRLYDKQAAIRSGFEWRATDEFRARVAASGWYAGEVYADPRLINGLPTRTSTSNHAYLLAPTLHWIPAADLAVDFGIEFAQAFISGSDLSSASRSQRSVFTSLEYSPVPDAGIVHDFVLVPAIRYDAYSDVAGDVSPRMGISAGLFDQNTLRLRASVSKSYHVPTFNDLYWLMGGNPRLLPERSVSFDAGAHSRLRFMGILDCDVALFSVSTRDRIVWVPGSSGLWSPRNYAAITSRGVEGSLTWTGPGDILRCEVNTTLMTSTKESADYPGDPTVGSELIYTPRQTTNAIVTAHMSGVAFSFRYSWVSYRYTTEINDHFLPSYGTASGAISYTMDLPGCSVKGKLEVTNLFNESYQIIALYPMPLRQLRGTLGVDL